ncbi:MAG TPA: hypothetical protein VI299_00395 [Polyangiales bacterium]
MALPGALIVLLLLTSASALAQDLHFLGADNHVLDAETEGLGISRRITHDRSLPRAAGPQIESSDRENFRVEFVDPSERANVIHAELESVGSNGERHGLLRHVALLRVPNTDRLRSGFVRLVSDSTDVSAPDVGFQLLRARLGDRIRVTIDDRTLHAEMSVGAASGARQPLRGVLRLTVLRVAPGGPPAVGDDDAQAITLARRQVEIANEIWAQCFIDFGPPERASVQVADPPPPALLAVSDLDGLPSLRASRVLFRANDKRIGPIAIAAGSIPERTAAALARALRKAGFQATVTTNPRAELGAGMSADVVVRDAKGELVRLSPDGKEKLSSDPQQTLTIGALDLSDGLDEFDNTLAITGTLEERTLVKLLADDDPSTIDVFLINRFVNRARQGEAFIEADGSSMANTLVFDRNAVRYERQAWVQAHELGHVLLDEAFHPDNIAADRPWLLMDADARQGRVTGPKRISDAECERARRRSGPGAHPVLLRAVSP